MEHFETLGQLKFDDLLREGLVEYCVFDGLDGSGKGTTTSEMARRLSEQGFPVLVVQFPQYNARAGIEVSKGLKGQKESLDIKQRMALYALNRLESVDKLKREVLELSENGTKEVKVIFDRFSTSNLVTAAFFLAKTLFKDKSVDELEVILESDKVDGIDLEKILKDMVNLDKYFHNLLGIDLSQIKIFIPRIEPEEAMRRILSDTTRSGADSYENLKVMIIADWLYRESPKHGVFNLVVNYQENTTSIEDVTNAADEIFFGNKPKREGLELGEIRNLEVTSEDSDYSPEVQQAIKNLLEENFPGQDLFHF